MCTLRARHLDFAHLPVELQIIKKYTAIKYYCCQCNADKGWKNDRRVGPKPRTHSSKKVNHYGKTPQEKAGNKTGVRQQKTCKTPRAICAGTSRPSLNALTWNKFECFLKTPPTLLPALYRLRVLFRLSATCD